jgi:hypothetical protein
MAESITPTIPPEINFLHKQYQHLHSSEGVGRAITRSGNAPDRLLPVDKLKIFLDFLKNKVCDEDPDKEQHKLAVMKRYLHQEYVIKPADIPLAYWDNQVRMEREGGDRNEHSASRSC